MARGFVLYAQRKQDQERVPWQHKTSESGWRTNRAGTPLVHAATFAAR